MKKIKRELVKKWLPTWDKDTYKNKMGHVLCIGGNKQMGGAIILSAGAALNSGAGLVTVASAPENMHALHARHPEAMFINFFEMDELIDGIKRADVIVLGPGLGLTEQAEEIFKVVLKTVDASQWLLLDGDALTILSVSAFKMSESNLVLTPHLGEWTRLTGIKAPADEIKQNQHGRKKMDATVILKKNRTEVYLEDDIWQNTAGNPSMATGGMGDTLTGILASFLGQFDDKKAALLSGVYVHSAVADELAETHYVSLPSTMIDYLPVFIKNLEK